MKGTKVLYKNLSANLLGNLSAQLISFITITYLARKLGPDGYGIFNFVQSYVMYFIFISDLGLGLYCIRYMNRNESSEDEINRIVTLKVILSGISSGIFLLTIIFVKVNIYTKISLVIATLSVFSTGIFFDFLFIGKNDTKFIGIANFIRNIIWFILCIIFIKNNNQVVLATLFYSIGILISSIYLYKKYKYKYKKIYFIFSWNKCKKIIKNSMPLAISGLMVTLNNNFSISYIGFTHSNDGVGNFSAGYKIVTFLLSILIVYFNSSYSIVANIFDDNYELSRYIEKFFSIGIYFILPITFGGMVVSNEIIGFFFGDGYTLAGDIFKVLILLVLIRMVSSTFSMVLIMGDKSKIYMLITIIGAFINVVVNIILINLVGIIGGAIAILISEIIQCIIIYKYYREKCKTNLIIISRKSIISSLLMVLIIVNININIILKILVGALTYGLLTLILNYKYFKRLIIKLVGVKNV